MQSKLRVQANVFWQIIRREMTIHMRNYRAQFINMLVMYFCNIITFAYLFQAAGPDRHFGVFYFLGSLVTFGFFGTINYAYELIGDIEGDRSINYLLTMPIPTKLVYCAIGVSWSLRTVVNIAPMFLIGKILLWDQLDLSTIHYGRFAFIFLIACFTYGFFGLWTATLFQRMSDIGNIWLRLVNPMFLFGAFFFSWKSVHAQMPIISYILLLNPILYANEGIRSSSLDPSSYLPFWVCSLVLCGCIVLFGAWGIHRLKRWLDSV